MVQSNPIVQKRILFIIVILVLIIPVHPFDFTSLAIKSSSTYSENKTENTIFVDQNNSLGPWTGSAQYPVKGISEALHLADPYDTICIQHGWYNETLTLLFPVRLIGVDLPVIDGGYNQTVINIKTYDVYIDNLCIIHSDGGNHDAGVFIEKVDNVTITNCIIHHTKTGIFVNHSDNVLINNSWFFHIGNAIKTNHSSNIIIHSCDFARNSIGLLMQKSENITLNFSTFCSNGLSGFFDQSFNITLRQCNITDNSVNKGGMFFSESQYISIHGVLFRHNGVGVSFSDVSSASIERCEFIKNTHFAISLRESSEQIKISDCLIQKNIRNGVYIEPENDCEISDSHIVNNAIYGILAEPSSSCIATNNWWGSSFGPWVGFLQGSNKVSFLQAKIITIPWRRNPFSHIGIQHLIPIPRYNHTFDESIYIPCESMDSDNDNVPDWWEEKWGYPTDQKNDHFTLDPDHDGLTNVQEWYVDEFGSNPFHKDVFLELDWMKCENGESNKPEQKWLQPIIDSYAEHNITLHIDTGSLGGGEEIWYQCNHIPTYAALEDMYWTYFLENDLQNPRKNIFHYGLLCNFCPDLNFPFVGWNALDSFAISVEWLSQSYPQYERQQLIAGGIAHHFGHTLGLIADKYEGIDNMETLRFFSSSWWNYRNYQSCMNYFYKYRRLTLSNGLCGEGDFNDWAHLDFSFFQKGTYAEN